MIRVQILQTIPKIKAVAIIPARYDSVRLPGKALLEIAGKPMICWVAERALGARNISGVTMATDDQRSVDWREMILGKMTFRPILASKSSLK